MVIVVFLAAYGILVTFGSVMSVLGSNQLREHPFLHSRWIGVNQAFNTYALGAYTDDTTATAYSWASSSSPRPSTWASPSFSSASFSVGRAARSS